MLLAETSHENRKVELYFVDNQYRLYFFENNVGLNKIVASYIECLDLGEKWLYEGLQFTETPLRGQKDE